jgi:hypothetical protein
VVCVAVHHVGYELIGAGMLIMARAAATARRSIMTIWSGGLVGYERGMAFRGRER